MNVWNKEHSYHLYYLSVLLFIFMSLPYLLNVSYMLAIIILFISNIGLLGLSYLYIKYALVQKQVMKLIIIGLASLIIGYSGSAIYLWINTNHSNNPSIAQMVKADDKIEKGVVYITYTDDCPFCRIAKQDVYQGIYTYISTHKKNVKLVNLNEDNELTKQINKDIDRKGSILKYNDDNRIVQMKTYIAMKQNYEPAAPGANHIYDLIKEIDNS